MSLRDRLTAAIARDGPISTADYMMLCLHDPDDGYYATRPRLGDAGDFVTAPLVSQMFGELLGLWAAEVWERLGAPPRARLVELGPGDGTMMGDVLRAAKAAPAFLATCEVWLVETSAPLRARQAAALEGYGPQWTTDIKTLPNDAPLIILANEFLDCLPIAQMVFVEGAWVQRRVGVDAKGDLSFFPCPSGERDFVIHEHSVALAETAREIAGLIGVAGGAALFIDYGRDMPGYGDTLQALRGHQKESPLAHPGEADLTAHVDFPAFAAAAQSAGAAVTPILKQGDFLRRLGVEIRAAALARSWSDKKDQIGRQLERLIAPDKMGDLFKVVCLHAPNLSPPGFEP